MASSSPPDPWREPRDPGAAPSIWDRYAEQAGGQAGSAPRGLDPGRPPERSQAPPPDRDAGAPWSADQSPWEPGTAEWESQPTWAQPPTWGPNQTGQRQRTPPPPPPPQPSGNFFGNDPYTGDPGQTPSRPPAPGNRNPYQPSAQPDPYRDGAYPADPYGPDPYGGAPYQPEPPPSDPYAMWGEPWAEQQDSGQLSAVRPRRRRWPLLLAAVVVVVLAVAFVPQVRELVSGSGSSSAAEAIALGEAGRDGPLEFTATAVDCRATTLGDTGITNGGVFCAVHMRVVNVGDAPVILDPAAQRLFDQGDQALTVNEEWLALDTRSFAQEIGPGVTANGVLMFDAPTGTQPSRLVLHAGAATEGVTIQVTGG